MRAALPAVAAAASLALLVAGLARVLRDGPGSGPAGGPGREGPIARTRAGALLAERLRRAGVPMAPEPFVAAVAAAAVAAAVVAAVVLRVPLAAPAAATAVGGAAAGLVRSADRRHAARMARQLPGVAQLLASALQAGLSLRQALTRAARDAPEPIRAELGRVVDELALGARVETALAALAARVPAREVRVMVTAILVQLRTGGNLARALASMAARLDERERLARELRGATAQARLTAWLVGALPVAGAAIAEIASPGTLGRLVGEGPGLVLLGVAGPMYLAGVALVRRLGDVGT